MCKLKNELLPVKIGDFGLSTLANAYDDDDEYGGGGNGDNAGAGRGNRDDDDDGDDGGGDSDELDFDSSPSYSGLHSPVGTAEYLGTALNDATWFAQPKELLVTCDACRRRLPPHSFPPRSPTPRSSTPRPFSAGGDRDDVRPHGGLQPALRRLVAWGGDLRAALRRASLPG